MKTYGSLFPRSALAAAVALVAAAPALAQNTTAAIGGRVATPDGKPVAGATVVVLHRESGSVSSFTICLSLPCLQSSMHSAQCGSVLFMAGSEAAGQK